MIGVIDVGGGNRGAFGAGIFDYCMDNNIEFDYCIGVSAGAANCASYVAGQRGRNYEFYTKYNLSRKAINPAKFFVHKSVINLDYIYGTLSNSGGKSPLDYPAMMKAKKKFVVVTEEAKTGRPKYFTKEDMSQNDYGIICASSCMPIVNKPYIVNGEPYYDGGIADPIPIDKALKDGCDKVVVILTLPKDYFRDNSSEARFADRIKEFPASRQAVIDRAELYNRELGQILDLEKEGKVLIISPKERAKIRTLGKDTSVIDNLYHEGYKKASKIKKFINSNG